MLIRMAAAALASGALGAPNNITISDDSSTGASGKTAGITFYNTGTYAKYINNVPIVQSNWITPQSNFSQYEIRATLSSGDTPSGTLATWIALTTSRTWALQTSVVDETLTCNLLIEIRWTGNNVVQDSATYTITAVGPSS